MIRLKGDKIYLRALEPEDLDFIYDVENDESVWEVSHTITPYSRFLIKQYLEQAHLDLFEAKQLRLVICNNQDKAVGLIDLFNYEPQHNRAGVGILIKDNDQRGKGVGKEALKMLIDYAFKTLNLHQIYCSVGEDNTASLSLFKAFKFKEIGLKKDWTFSNGSYKNEYLFQLINTYVH